MIGATVTSDKPVGVELNAGGVDNYSIRNAPIYPATWYSNTYYYTCAYFGQCRR